MVFFDLFKNNKLEQFRLKQLTLLTEFKKLMSAHNDTQHTAIVEKIDDCLKACQKTNTNFLVLVSPIKRLTSYVGSMVYDNLISLTLEEENLWKEIKAENGHYDKIGHGSALF